MDCACGCQSTIWLIFEGDLLCSGFSCFRLNRFALAFSESDETVDAWSFKGLHLPAWPVNLDLVDCGDLTEAEVRAHI